MASSSDAASEEEMTLALKWAGKDFTVRVCADDTVGELKRRICEVTNVLPKRQKLLNLKVGAKPAPDSSLLSSVTLKPGIKISMMGYLSVCFVHLYVFTPPSKQRIMSEIIPSVWKAFSWSRPGVP